MKFWETQEFKALQKTWYQRLEGEGFQDAERLVGSMLELRAFSVELIDLRSKSDYYTAMSARTHDEEFRSEVDRLIMIRHAEGKKIRQICQELALFGEKRCRNTVCFTIRRYEILWGIRHYVPRKVNARGRVRIRLRTYKKREKTA